MKIEWSLVDETPPMTMDSALRMITMQPDATKPVQITKELEWFGSYPHPFSSYINHLFVFPEVASIKHNHAGIRVQVSLLDDDTLSKAPLAVIYSKWEGTLFTDAQDTAICIKEKKYVPSRIPNV